MTKKRKNTGPAAGPQDPTLTAQAGREKRMDPTSRRLLYLGVVIAALAQVLDGADIIPQTAGDIMTAVGVLLLLVCFIRVQYKDKKPKRSK